MHGAPVTWPGQAPDEVATDEAATAEATPAGGTTAGGTAAEAAEAEAAEAEASGPEPTADEPESADLPLWDWSPPAERSAQEPSGAAPREPAAAAHRGAAHRGAARRGARGPAKPEWKPVVTPVEEAGGGPRPGIGQRRGNLAHLSANPRMRIWQLRAVVAVVVLAAFSILVSWKLGLTLAVIAIIADTIYRSRQGLRRQGQADRRAAADPQAADQARPRGLPRHARQAHPGAARTRSTTWWSGRPASSPSTRRPGTSGWPCGRRTAPQLWHGPFSKKDRLEHAQWEAQRAADLLSGAIGKPVAVRPAMAVYGPKIPWDVATIREVDVFSGPRLRKYLRRRARQGEVRPLTDEEIERIYTAANQAFPHLSSGSQAS